MDNEVPTIGNILVILTPFIMAAYKDKDSKLNLQHVGHTKLALMGMINTLPPNPETQKFAFELIEKLNALHTKYPSPFPVSPENN